MTKTLTEQWREGTLPDGKYYIKLEPNFTERYDVGYSEGGDFALYNTEDIEEVLAPVPSYDEHNELKQDNKYLKSGIETRDKQIEQLVKRLEIATKALKRIDPPNIIFDDYRNSGIDLWEIAHNALKEMEGVK